MQVEFDEGGITVDAHVLSELLNLPAAEIPALMREGAITSLCERGAGEHEGQYRLTFFHGSRRARLNVAPPDRILRRSVIDYGSMGRATGNKSRGSAR